TSSDRATRCASRPTRGSRPASSTASRSSSSSRGSASARTTRCRRSCRPTSSRISGRRRSDRSTTPTTASSACRFASSADAVHALALALLLVAAGPRFDDLERVITADPENLAVAAEYRQDAIAAGAFDRSIDFFEKLARRKGSGPNVQISLALAYVDKVPVAGDIRRLYLGRDAINALTRSITQ